MTSDVSSQSVRHNLLKDVFNGDIGQIVKIDPVERRVIIRFDQRDEDVEAQPAVASSILAGPASSGG
jgi:ATP-dependent exoDNAse (exonuclease V) alpha subunit